MELDSNKVYEQFDPEDVGYGIENLPEQVRMAWEGTRDIKVPASFSSVKNAVIVGMGGSNLGPHMLLSAFKHVLSLPVELINDYELPGYVNRDTLVILSSFSGTTEEVLSCAEDAKQSKAKVMAISAGGKLSELATTEHWPCYVFEPGDLAKQPRCGTGFSLVGILGLLERAGLVKIKETDLQGMITAMGDVIDNCAVDVVTEENPAKQVAHELVGKNLLVIAAEHLAGNAHTFSNQINETAKQFCQHLFLPELNHHFLEGLRFPVDLPTGSTAFMVRSELYHPRIQKRCDITADILEEHGISVIDYVCRGETALEEVGEMLQFGSYVSWYLAMLNKVVTTDIKIVEGFKERMANE